MNIETKINGFEEYVINGDGEVFSIVYRNQNGVFNRRRKLKPHNNRVSLRKDGKNYSFAIDVLVANHFVENEKGYKYIKHIDGNKDNNNYLNLKWIKDNPIYDNKIGFKNISSEGYEFIVIKFKNYNDVTIEFNDEHKAKVRTQWKECLKGNIRNPFHKTIYNVACLGLDKYGKRPKTTINGNHTREYTLWQGMVERCYNTKCKGYKYYGEKGVKVCSRWLVFSNFLEDITKIENYELWKNNHTKIHLDKDIKSGNNKIYSLETCIFVTLTDNVKQRNEDNGLPIKPCKKIIGINKNTNETIIFNNIHEVMDNLNIKSKSNVYYCINHPNRTCGGYYFKWYDGGGAK